MTDEEWFNQMLRMGMADIKMDIDGEWMTPREYMRKRGR